MIDVTAVGGHLTVEAQALSAIIALLTTLNAAMVPTPIVEEPETEDGEAEGEDEPDEGDGE